MSYSFTGLGVLPKHLGQRKAQEKKLGCKMGAEYTSKGWRCREQNPTVQKQKKYQDALRLKALAKKLKPKVTKLTQRRAGELLRQGRARVAAARASSSKAPPENVKIGNLTVAPIPIDPAKDVAVVTANEESLVTAEETADEDEGGLGIGGLLAGAAAVAAVGGIAYLLLRNKGGGAAPARTSAKRSTRSSSPRSTQRSSSRSTLPSGTAVMPNRSGTTKRGRWWLYSAPSGNYLLTTRHHSGGPVPITIDDVTHGSAKRLGHVTAPWPRYASQADDLVQKVSMRENASKKRPHVNLELARFFYKRGNGVRRRSGNNPQAAYSGWRKALEDGNDLLVKYQKVMKVSRGRAVEEAIGFYEAGLFTPSRRRKK